jgi:SAM-dependent methyltransferase
LAAPHTAGKEHPMSDYFAKKAKAWDAQPMREAMADAFIAELEALAPLGPDTDALEFGAGTGLVGLKLAPRLRSLALLDTSPAMLEVLREKLAPLRLPNVTAHEQDLAATPWAGPAPRLLYSLMVMHHVPSPPDAIAAFHAALATGGTVVIADALPEDGSFHGDQPAPHNGFDPDAVLAWFKAAGFADLAAHPFHTLHKPGPDGALRGYGLFVLSGRKR